MKNIHILLDNEEFERANKKKLNLTWREFIMQYVKRLETDGY